MRWSGPARDLLVLQKITQSCTELSIPGPDHLTLQLWQIRLRSFAMIRSCTRSSLLFFRTTWFLSFHWIIYRPWTNLSRIVNRTVFSFLNHICPILRWVDYSSKSVRFYSVITKYQRASLQILPNSSRQICRFYSLYPPPFTDRFFKIILNFIIIFSALYDKCISMCVVYLFKRLLYLEKSSVSAISRFTHHHVSNLFFETFILGLLCAFLYAQFERHILYLSILSK